MKKTLSDLLLSKKLRKTPQRLQILDCFLRSQLPLSAEDIYKMLKQETCDLATVYRNLQQLEECGLLEKTYLSDQLARYQLASLDQKNHTHHIECRACHQVTALDLCLVENQLKALEKMGFKKISHRLEFQALCPQCAS